MHEKSMFQMTMRMEGGEESKLAAKLEIKCDDIAVERSCCRNAPTLFSARNTISPRREMQSRLKCPPAENTMYSLCIK